MNKMDKQTRIVRVPNCVDKVELCLGDNVAIDFDKSDLASGLIVFKNKYKTFNDIPVKNHYSGLDEQSTPKMRATAMLYDIAHYYNNGAKPDFNNDEDKYYIVRSYEGIYTLSATAHVAFPAPCFINREDAEEVIHNPYFVEILDTIWK